MVYVVSACVRACMLYCLCGGWQGLRTLELCVDNLQPEFLYNHIQPVRAELMQVTVMLCSFRQWYSLFLHLREFFFRYDEFQKKARGTVVRGLTRLGHLPPRCIRGPLVVKTVM